MAEETREDWDRQMRQAVGCGCGDPDQAHIDHRYAWEGGCRPYRPVKPYVKPPVGFRCKLTRPKFNRYRVADHGFRITRNRYRGDPGFPSAWIGLALVVGAWSYGVRWGKPDLVRESDST